MGIPARLVIISSFFLLYSTAAIGRDKPVPEEYGRVIINNFSSRAGLAPVRFNHWLHRAIFTCRLCHVDIGFAMQANETKIKADTIVKGFYCGACHNGARIYSGRKIFAACSTKTVKPEERKRCDRCHSVGKNLEKKIDYTSFTAQLPKQKYWNLVDWEEAEADWLIRPIDFLEGVSVQRPALNAQKDFSITSKSTWMPDIIFSHKKHNEWNGCEVCHPEIFPSVKKDAVKYSMLEISGGQYCGVCHGRVAFPLDECERCHSKPVAR